MVRERQQYDPHLANPIFSLVRFQKIMGHEATKVRKDSPTPRPASRLAVAHRSDRRG